MKLAFVGGLVALACLVAGWYYFKGPGRDMLRELAGSLSKDKRKAEPTLVADSDDRPVMPLPDKEPPVKSKPPVEPTPMDKPPMPAPTPMPPKNPPAVAGVTFEKHILPIFEAKCVNCHGNDKKRGGLDVRSVAALLKGGDNGPTFKPGTLDGSTLWESLQTDRMPSTPNKLNAAEKKLIQEWILGGAK